MTAHVHYPSLDPINPATLSPTILTNLLRQEMGFRHLIVSDDLEMRAILDHVSIGDAAVRSLQAGVDILLICKTRELETDAIESVARAVDAGDIPQHRLASSLTRLQTIKHRFACPSPPISPTQARTRIGIAAHRELVAHIQDQARRSL